MKNLKSFRKEQIPSTEPMYGADFSDVGLNFDVIGENSAGALLSHGSKKYHFDVEAVPEENGSCVTVESNESRITPLELIILIINFWNCRFLDS